MVRKRLLKYGPLRNLEAALAAPVIQFEDVEIDLGKFEVRRGGLRVHLEKQPFDLLVLLLRNRGNLVPRKEIAESLCDSNVFVETDRSINNAIRKIRIALGDDPEHPRFIETVPGRGDRFIAKASFASAGQPGAIPQQIVFHDGNSGLVINQCGAATAGRGPGRKEARVPALRPSAGGL